MGEFYQKNGLYTELVAEHFLSWAVTLPQKAAFKLAIAAPGASIKINLVQRQIAGGGISAANGVFHSSIGFIRQIEGHLKTLCWRHLSQRIDSGFAVGD